MAASAAAAAAGIVDPTKPAKYPVILSDALLGKPAKEIYTGVRYNHKPPLSSDAAPGTARLRPRSGSSGAFDLSFSDDGGRYAYTGTRAAAAAGDGGASNSPFVLVFDPDRKAFVLHRVDSVFDMNLTRTPSDTDPESLKKQHPHIESGGGSSSGGGGGSGSGAKAQAGGKKASAEKQAGNGGKASGARQARAGAAAPSAAARRPRAEKKEAPVSLTLPAPPKPADKQAEGKKKGAKSTPLQESDEEDDDDDDGGLLVEYPEGHAPPPRYHPPPDFSPAFPSLRRFSDFAREGEQGPGGDGGDADAGPDKEGARGRPRDEDGDDAMGAFKLPSPVGNRADPPAGAGAAAADEDEDNGIDFEDALEAELEKEFGMDVDSESSVSEED